MRAKRSDGARPKTGAQPNGQCWWASADWRAHHRMMCLTDHPCIRGVQGLAYLMIPRYKRRITSHARPPTSWVGGTSQVRWRWPTCACVDWCGRDVPKCKKHQGAPACPGASVWKKAAKLVNSNPFTMSLQKACKGTNKEIKQSLNGRRKQQC